MPGIWTHGSIKRVQVPGLTMKQQTLLLLAHSAAPTSEADLVRWIEPATAKDYRRDVLVALHKERYVEYDRQAGVVHLTDRGNSYVEDNLMAYL